MVTPENFIKEIELYLNKNEIDINTLTSYNIDYNNNEKLLWGNDIFDFNYGATRGCFIPAYNPTFVLKFDFSDLWEEYCAIEVETYKDAKKRGLENCFARIQKYDVISNTWLYKSEYIDKPYVLNNNLLTAERRLELEQRTADRCPTVISPYWAEDFITCYGNDKYDKFLDFIASHGINDLNSHNLGYKKGKPIVFDYAGFFEDSSSYSCKN